MKIDISIPSKKLLSRLDPAALSPEFEAAERKLAQAEEETAKARKELAEFSAILEELPTEVILGRAPADAVEEMVTRERAAALTLKAQEERRELARRDLADAQAETRVAVIAEGARLCELLKKMVDPIVPLLEAVKELDYEISRRVSAANMNPERGAEFPRERLPDVKWPRSLMDDQALKSWMESSPQETEEQRNRAAREEIERSAGPD